MHNAALADKIAERVSGIMRGEDIALKAVGATDDEIQALKSLTRSIEAEATEVLGKTVKTAVGDIHLSKSGHITAHHHA